jgi:two-component system, NtrC family, sensor kinase
MKGWESSLDYPEGSTMTRDTPNGGSPGSTSEAQDSRVLVIDDEPMMGTTLRMALAEDHEVVFVQSGEAARELLQRDRHFDAIVCDLMMPDVSGMDLHRWLDERDAELASRMIFMTGGAYTEASRRFLGSVDNPQIQKPFDVSELLDLVGRIRQPRASTS